MERNTMIINTGGTFNKKYDAKSGLLKINKNNKIIKSILKNLYKSNVQPKIKGLIYKDSLDITKKDRHKLVNFIQSRKEEKIIIIHGTDTMNKTAKFIQKYINNKQIIFVGSMIPYDICTIEASTNLGMALGYLKNNTTVEINICMNGIINNHTCMKKNYNTIVYEDISN
jgi:L-asparaginase